MNAKDMIWDKREPFQFYDRYETEDHIVEFMGRSTGEYDNIEFHYTVSHMSYECYVKLTYAPLDANDVEEDGRIACDVDVSGGGDCVHPRDVLAYIAAALEAHEKQGHAPDLRATDG